MILVANEYNWFNSMIRSLWTIFDNIVYKLVAWVYEIFFLVAEQEIVSSATVTDLFRRVYLILGMFMMFKLIFSLLQSVVNPEMLTDKQKGFGKIVQRSLIAVLLLITLVPTSLSNSDDALEVSSNELSFEKQIEANGLLFGALYTVQNRILNNNVLGKIILGVSDTTGENTNSTTLGKSISSAGNNVATEIYKSFVFPNSACTGVIDPDNPDKPNYSEIPYYDDTYVVEGVSPSDVAELVNANCKDTDGNKIFAYEYLPIVSAIAGGFVVFMLFSYTLDIAIRSIKIAVLRLVAPIPVISYIDPKSEKDGAFGAWSKNLISTYLDLFIKLIIIYFSIFIVAHITTDGLSVNLRGQGIIGGLVLVSLILGIFFFAKQAPKFIKDILGVKSSGGGSIGLAGMLGGAAAAIGGGGLAGFALGASQGATMASEAAAQGKAAPSAWGTMRDQMAKIRTGDKDARGGLVGSFMDRQLYNTRERQLAKKGLTFDNMNEAKKNMYDKKDIAHQAQIDRDLAWGKLEANGFTDPGSFAPIDEPNRDDYITEYGTGIYREDGTEIMSERFDESAYNTAMEEYNSQTEQRSYAQALWDDFERKDAALSIAETNAAKAESNYKSVKDARSALGVDPRMVDQYTTDSRFNRATRAYRSAKDRSKFSPTGTSAGGVDDTGPDRVAPETGGSPPGGGPGMPPPMH